MHGPPIEYCPRGFDYGMQLIGLSVLYDVLGVHSLEVIWKLLECGSGSEVLEGTFGIAMWERLGVGVKLSTSTGLGKASVRIVLMTCYNDMIGLVGRGMAGQWMSLAQIDTGLYTGQRVEDLESYRRTWQI